MEFLAPSRLNWVWFGCFLLSEHLKGVRWHSLNIHGHHSRTYKGPSGLVYTWKPTAFFFSTHSLQIQNGISFAWSKQQLPPQTSFVILFSLVLPVSLTRRHWSKIKIIIMNIEAIGVVLAFPKVHYFYLFVKLVLHYKRQT